MAGDTSNRLAGTAYVTVDGISVMVEGSFKYQPSTVGRLYLPALTRHLPELRLLSRSWCY